LPLPHLVIGSNIHSFNERDTTIKITFFSDE
jgi:hypothetical protein